VRSQFIESPASGSGPCDQALIVAAPGPPAQAFRAFASGAGKNFEIAVDRIPNVSIIRRLVTGHRDLVEKRISGKLDSLENLRIIHRLGNTKSDLGETAKFFEFRC
jgi:hypothetical protein